MLLTYKESKFVLQCKYSEKDKAKGAGFRWDASGKLWYTNAVDIAVRLSSCADATTQELINNLRKTAIEAVRKSVATDANIDVPSPAGLSYLPYQKAGIAYALERKATLFGDDMGLGKTIQAIGVINARPAIAKVLIVCPASLKINWSRETAKWLTRDLTIGVAAKTFPENDIVIVNYDILKKYEQAISSQKWDLIICDEAHFVRNTKAQRSKILAEIAHAIPQRILLTGTPISNRPKELWHLLHVLDPEAYPYFLPFGKRYCGGYNDGEHWHFDGASNLAELQRVLRETVMVRRMKKDVLKELPPKRRQIIEVPTDGEGAIAIKAEKSAQLSLSGIKTRRKALEKLKKTLTDEQYKAEVSKLKTEMAGSLGEIAKLRHMTALAKVPYVVSHCKEALEAEEKIIVFAHHKDVIDGIMEGLADFNPVSFHGGTKQEDRQAAVDSFQSDKKVRVFVGGITTAGTGITLTAASTVIFAELDWVPGTLSQCEDRANRIGQVNSVLIQHIVLDGSIDAFIAKTVVKKQAIIEKAVDMSAPEMTEAEIAELVYESFDGDAVVEEVIGEVDEVDEPLDPVEIAELAALKAEAAAKEESYGAEPLDPIEIEEAEALKAEAEAAKEEKTAMNEELQ